MKITSEKSSVVFGRHIGRTLSDMVRVCDSSNKAKSKLTLVALYLGCGKTLCTATCLKE